MELQIEKIEEVKGLKPEVVNDLQKHFSNLFSQAKEWEEKSKEIVVKSVEDVEMMARAREARLMLKKIRVDAERIRKELKEESLLKGRAIDGVANIIKYLVIPVENRLEQEEKFIQLQEEKRLQDLADDRTKQLIQYEVDTTVYDLKLMQEEAFQTLLESSKIVYEKRQEELRKEEEARIEREKKEREEQERIRLENEKLKAEALKREQELAKERAKQEEKAKKEREAMELKMKKEREAREKIERELKAKKEAELRAKQEAEKKEKEEQKRLKAMQLAPDKDKLRVLAGELLKIEYPELQTDEGKKILEDVKVLMKKVNVYIVENIDRLN